MVSREREDVELEEDGHGTEVSHSSFLHVERQRREFKNKMEIRT